MTNVNNCAQPISTAPCSFLCARAAGHRICSCPAHHTNSPACRFGPLHHTHRATMSHADAKQKTVMEKLRYRYRELLDTDVSIPTVMSEVIGVFGFVLMGTGAAVLTNEPEVYPPEAARMVKEAIIGFAFGLGILFMIYATAHNGSGHLNPAVTISLIAAGACSIVQGILNIAAQVRATSCPHLRASGGATIRRRRFAGGVCSLVLRLGCFSVRCTQGASELPCNNGMHSREAPAAA